MSPLLSICFSAFPVYKAQIRYGGAIMTLVMAMINDDDLSPIVMVSTIMMMILLILGDRPSSDPLPEHLPSEASEPWLLPAHHAHYLQGDGDGETGTWTPFAFHRAHPKCVLFTMSNVGLEAASKTLHTAKLRRGRYRMWKT